MCIRDRSSGYYDAYFKKAGQVRTLIMQDFAKVFEKYDLILGPTAPTVAYDLGSQNQDPVAMYLADLLTIPVNLAGLPGISIPAGFADGLPVGLQLIGKMCIRDRLWTVMLVLLIARDVCWVTLCGTKQIMTV